LRYITPDKIKFYPEFKSDLKIKNWKFLSNFGYYKIIDTSGTDNEIPVQNVNIVFNKNQFRHGTNSLDYQFEVLTVKDMKCEKTGMVPCVFQTTDSTLDRYSLILFDFDSYKLSEANSAIADFIDKNIAKDENNNILGTVEIKGYTDNIGSESYNLQLSQKRAEALAKLLKLEGTKIKVEGLGETSPLYSQDSPEGRFYCRTVTVIVKNPLKQKR
jgi:outer membrane protein OmpA-like peptidoglycan-associated protein